MSPTVQNIDDLCDFGWDRLHELPADRDLDPTEKLELIAGWAAWLIDAREPLPDEAHDFLGEHGLVWSCGEVVHRGCA